MPDATTPVNVELIVPPDFSRSGEPVSVRVMVEDVSDADARAKTIAQKLIETTVEPGKHIQATIDVPRDAVGPQRSYNVRAHVSLNQTDTIQAGDLITTQSFPVLTTGQPDRVELPLRQVK